MENISEKSYVELSVKINRYEKRINELEEKLSRAFTSNPVSMAISTIEEGLYLDVNDSFVNTFGYGKEVVIGYSSKELKLFVDIKQRNLIARILKTNNIVNGIEIRIRSKSGEILTCLFSAQIINYKGRECLLTVMSDMSKRANEVEKLKRKETLYRLLFNAYSDPVLLLNKGIISECNQRAAEWLKGSQEDLCGRVFCSIAPAKQTNGKPTDSTFKRKCNDVLKKGYQNCSWYFIDLQGNKRECNLKLSTFNYEDTEYILVVIH